MFLIATPFFFVVYKVFPVVLVTIKKFADMTTGYMILALLQNFDAFLRLHMLLVAVKHDRSKLFGIRDATALHLALAYGRTFLIFEKRRLSSFI